MNHLVLIRHVETDLAGTFCGHSDPDLNAAGEHRLRSLREEVASLGIELIYSSDLRRASRTAMAIGKHIGAPVELRPGLREIHFGLWEGLRWDEVLQRYPREAQLWASEFPTRRAPGGEAYRDFGVRIETEFRAVIDGRKSGARAAVVAHRGVMQYVLTRFFGFSADDARTQTESYGAIVIANLPELRDADRAGIRA
jgi:broad specificity phosphatase PhoE